MTNRTLSQLVTYWRNLLQLHDWNFLVKVVSEDELPEGAETCCSAQLDAKTATLFFGANHDDEARKAQVIHECLHVACTDLRESLLRSTRGYLPHGVRNTLKCELLHQEEMLVLRLERAFMEVTQ